MNTNNLQRVKSRIPDGARPLKEPYAVIYMNFVCDKRNNLLNILLNKTI